MSKRSQILTVAQRLVAEQGLAALTFDALAAQLGVSKQAVLYWFRSKDTLMEALALPALEAEADAVICALESGAHPRGPEAALVEAVVRFHRVDLDRFRMIYLAPQSGGRRAPPPQDVRLSDRIHPVTDRMYGAAAAALGGGPETRARALALHGAALGVVLMIALADALGDPLKQPDEALIAALVDSVSRAPA